MFEDIVGTESVHTNVFTHGDKLRSTQIIQCDIVMEQLGDSYDIGIRRGFSSGSYLHVSSETFMWGIRELTFRKKRLNSSLLMTLSILSPDPRTVSCKNLAISIRTRSNLRCFSAYPSVLLNSRSEIKFTAAKSPSKVEGSMLGKSLSATGSKNSMKGIRTKGRKGIRRSRSVVVRFNYIR
jgi:hypothetical protein